jgi:hypothetical protein
VRALDAEAVHDNLAIQLPSLESSKLHVKDESKGKKGFSEEEVKSALNGFAQFSAEDFKSMSFKQ